MNRREFLRLMVAAQLAALGCLATPGRRSNVVCILVDELRKDSFDAWAPRTRDLGERGVRFEGMRSVAPCS